MKAQRWRRGIKSICASTSPASPKDRVSSSDRRLQRSTTLFPHALMWSCISWPKSSAVLRARRVFALLYRPDSEDSVTLRDLLHDLHLALHPLLLLVVGVVV